MKKIVIVINGKGEAGKDTICEIVSRHYKSINVSSITPIKEIAAKHGWNGEKDKKARRFLSDLKKAFSEYNDLPTQYLLSEYESFIADSEHEIMFAHIREASEISRFANLVTTPLVTLYIDRPGIGRYGNKSDDNADRLNYDYVYVNEQPLELLESDFMRFFNNIVEQNRGKP